MFYQLWESEILPYNLYDPGYGGIQHNGCFVYGDWVSQYAETLNCQGSQVMNVYVQRKKSEGSETNVYIYAIVSTRYHPGWGIRVYAVRGNTGALMWMDDESYWMNVFGLGLASGMFADLEDRIWITHDYGYCYKTSICTEGTSVPPENNYAKAEGMPHLMYYDVKINNSEWKSYNGDPWPDVNMTVSKMVAMIPSQNRGVGLLNMAKSGIPGDGGQTHYLCVFDYETRYLLYTIRIPSTPGRCIVVDSQTLYCFCSGGAMCTVDYKLGRLTGVQYPGTYQMGNLAGRFVPVGYDPVYRRIYASPATPDDPETGASTTRVKAYAPIEIPIGMSKPIPTSIPRQGRKVKVFTRVHGDGGHGIPGQVVTASIVSGGSNTLSPNSTLTNEAGIAWFDWQCNDSGTDIDEISLECTFEDHNPDFTPSSVDPTTIDPPTNVENTLYFHPGYWAWAPYSTDTPATKWDSFLPGYEETGVNPVVGVVQEYYWNDIEVGISTYDYSKIQADIDYLSALGYKLAIHIRLHSLSDEETGVPQDILDYDQPPIIDPETGLPYDPPLTPLYPQSEQPECLGLGGVIHLTHTQGYGYYPCIWHSTIQTRFNTFLLSLASHFASDSNVAGYFPVGKSYVDYRDLGDSNTGGSSNTLETARRALLVSVDGLTNRPVWDEFVGDIYGSHNWYKSNGINWSTHSWYLEFTEHDESYFNNYWSRGDYKSIATGVHIRAENWGQDDCTGADATPLEFVWGGPDFGNDSGCNKVRIVSGSWWFVFFDLTEPEWSNTDGIETTCLDTQLPLADKYLG